MMLLGAGASKEAGVPLAREMSARILDHLSTDRRNSHLLRFVLGGLLFQAGINGASPLESVDVEELFSAVELLAQRRQLEIAPFIGAWHPMVESLDRVDRHSSFAGVPRNLERAIEKVFPSSSQARSRSWPDVNSRPNQRALGKAITETIHNEVTPGTGLAYRELTSEMVQALQELLHKASKDVAYLEPLASLSRIQGRLTVATLNYDRTVELMGERYDVPVNTGIEQWSHTGNLSTDQPWTGIRLLKLHGSIDWTLQPLQRSAERPMPHTLVRLRTSEDGYLTMPAIVFGQRNKLRHDGPFLDLLREFREELRHSSRLVVVGYSFRDDHINKYLADWLNDDPSNAITVIDPSFDHNDEGFANDLRVACASRLKVIALPASEGLKSLA